MLVLGYFEGVCKMCSHHILWRSDDIQPLCESFPEGHGASHRFLCPKECIVRGEYSVHKECTYENVQTDILQSSTVLYLYLQSFYLVWNPSISCQLINTFCSYHCTGGRGLVGSSFEIIIGMAQQWFICSQITILIWFLFYLSTSKHTQSACKRL